ncbi:MAG: hypothetical protein V1688_03700, partial [bacterium]
LCIGKNNNLVRWRDFVMKSNKLKFLVSFLTLLVISMFAVNSACAGWHEWSQRARNEAILNAAYKDINKTLYKTVNGKKVGVSCKVWVQDVVKNASNGAAVVPATTDTFPYYYWKPSKDVLSRSGRIESAVSGEIVQMYTTYGLHTAIVWEISKSGVTFIECNWCLPACYIVKKRYIDFVAFNKQVPCGNFTINTIL